MTRTVTILIVGVAALVHPLFAAEPKPHRFEDQIQAFETQDREHPPPQGATLFLGSSSIRGWNTRRWFPDRPVLNRGFGGSIIADSTFYFGRIVGPYQPKTVVFYAGDNDVAGKHTAQQVLADFKELVARLHEALPETRLVFLSIKPSPKRWAKWPVMQAANQLVAEMCEADELLTFVDVGTCLLGDDGRPREELYKADLLHLNDDGYQAWTNVVKPVLDRMDPPQADEG